MRTEWSNKDSLEIPEITAGYGSVSWSDYKTGTSCDSVVLEAEPVRHGHWIGESQTKFEKLLFSQRVFKCSVCGNYLDFDGVNVGRGSANFCPNCGAKMDEEKENANNN